MLLGAGRRAVNLAMPLIFDEAADEPSILYL